jgi:hypothetical protein
MNLINHAAIGACLFVSVSAAAQTNEDTTTNFTPPVIVKDKDSVQKSENKKEEYRSKEWRQGVELADTVNKSTQRRNPGMNKKSKRKVAPPPPPLAPPDTPATPLKK